MPSQSRTWVIKFWTGQFNRRWGGYESYHDARIRADGFPPGYIWHIEPE